jgi:hypothetical protein
VCLQAMAIPGTGGETSRELSLSRELSTNEIALFSIVFYINAQRTEHLHSTENINRKKIFILIQYYIKMFLVENLKCCSTTTKDLLAGKRYFQCYFHV